MPDNDSFSLFSSVKVVRDLMRRKLDDGASQAQGELEAGLQEIEALWEELRNQSHVLASERQRYSEFFEYAPDAYLITDSHGTVREANRAAAELLGVPARSLEGRPLVNMVAEPGRRDFRARLVRASAQPEGEISAWRGALQGPQGAAFQAGFRVRALPVPDGGLASLCWLVRRVD
jgi:PAS domain S-box-containing protein